MVDEAYADRTEWIKKSIRTTAKVCCFCLCDTLTSIVVVRIQMGKFSSDRAILDYAQEYWSIESVKVK